MGIAHVDVSQLSILAEDVSHSQNQNNDAIIYTVGQLLLELGQMFKVGKVQDLTTTLQQQLNELTRNSNHPQMLRNKSLRIDTSMDNDEEDDDDKALIMKMSDRVD